MADKHRPKWNIEDISDAEVDAAIRYLEPGPRTRNEKQGDAGGLVVSIIFVVVMLGFLELVWLYR
jgi:hypothetical protein